MQYDVVVICLFMLKYLCKALAFHLIGNLVSLFINAVRDNFLFKKKKLNSPWIHVDAFIVESKTKKSNESTLVKCKERVTCLY